MAIKSRPADFMVEEELTPEIHAQITGRVTGHAIYSVRKRSLTTHELLDALARRLQAPIEDLAAAGLKDKHADTVQHVTVRVRPDRRLPPGEIRSPTFHARMLGYLPQSIDARAIHRNRFELVVRNLTRTAVGEIKDAAERMADKATSSPEGASELCITNYFGNQRFGSARAQQGFIAKYLVLGNFERALQLSIGVPHRKDLHRVKQFKQAIADAWPTRDWRSALKTSPKIPERAALEHLVKRPDDFRGAFAELPYFFQQLSVEAYQSLLWNRIVTELLVDRMGDSGRLWVVDDHFGRLVFAEPSAIPADLRHLEIPLLSNKTRLEPPWQHAAERVLEEEQLTVEQLAIPGLKRPWFGEFPRSVFMIVEKFRLGGPQPDELNDDRSRIKLSFNFSLPRGGYATVVLRALGQ